MMKGVLLNIDANIHMDGRNKNTIPRITKCISVGRLKSVKNLTVHTIIVTRTSVVPLVNTTDISPRIGELEINNLLNNTNHCS